MDTQQQLKKIFKESFCGNTGGVTMIDLLIADKHNTVPFNVNHCSECSDVVVAFCEAEIKEEELELLRNALGI